MLKKSLLDTDCFSAINIIHDFFPNNRDKYAILKYRLLCRSGYLPSGDNNVRMVSKTR